MQRFISGIGLTVIGTVAAAIVFWAATTSGAEEKIAVDQLPKAVVDAVKAKFPGAELQGGEKEVADGKTIYEVNLKYKGAHHDVSLTPEGKIIEIEKTIAAKDLPAAVTKGLDQKYPKATIELAEEITVDNKLKYEVIIVTAEKKKFEVVLEPSGKIVKEEAKDEKEKPEAAEEKIPLDKLPKVVLDAVKAKFPGAELQSATKEDEDGTLVYEVALKHKGADIEVILSLEGKIQVIEKTITVKDLPAAVSKALAEKYPKATVKKTEELTKDDKLSYEIIIETADKKTLEVVFDPNGKVIEEEAKEGDEE
jgi:uncharacterized membrane protein YkoI